MGKKITEKEIIQQRFTCFNVSYINNSYSFLHIDIRNDDDFYEKLFDYFFSEDKLVGYCEHMSSIKFEPTPKQFIMLYKHLKIYLDDYNLDKEISELDEEVIEILKQENLVSNDENGKLICRLDKLGKVGEYIFSCLLEDYFGFDCIIPKVHLTTDYNMSIYGIDTLFYNEKENLLMFGESKISVRIDNGISLIKKSLKDYEKQISDEFELVLSNRLYKDKLYKFEEVFGEQAEMSLNIQQFIEKANITKIGIPLFIAHGCESDTIEILNKLEKIVPKKMLNIETIYYAISLPILNKEKLIAVFTRRLREKGEEYKDGANK